ncbi:MFS transporter [Brucella anthropi]|uniref:MFS transporter n=1 Tax=Brucella anthropi TaxID=529 RepID=UPI00124D13A5|nr:MFS transporter [Brucella anthropi]KAB2726464.1 MFS transporter [Brucella anthropi]KAB2743626.1 MFS transporter [Brucella anthropi]KAB2804373.1 MFS transporter [Brucella anthropi]
MNQATRTAVVITVTATIFGLTYGLSAPLIALQLAEAGFSESFIGANGAMYAVGVLLAAPFMPRLFGRFGFARLARSALLGAGSILLLFPAAPFLWIWFPLRAALGAVSETLFVVSEAWLNHLASEASRGRLIAIYMTALSCGTALGPTILALVGRHELWAFVIGALVTFTAWMVLVVGKPKEPKSGHEEIGNPFRYLRLVPVAVASAALNAALEAAGLSLLPIYAVNLGWPEQSATILLTVLLIGSITMQLPIGWLGDRMPRSKLLGLLALIATVGAAFWPLALAHAWFAYPLLFVWGGVFVGIYTTTVAMLGDLYEGGELVGIYALLSVAWGVGAFAGPLVCGIAMEMTLHGLPLFAAVACGVFGLASIFMPIRSRVSAR